MRRRREKKNKEIRPIRIRPRGSIYFAIYLLTSIPLFLKKKNWIKILTINFNHFLNAFSIYDDSSTHSMIDDDMFENVMNMFKNINNNRGV